MRPVESISIVAVSLSGNEIDVGVVRVGHNWYVFPAGTCWTDTSCGELPWRRTCATSPSAFTSARALVLADRCRTFVQVSLPSSRHNQLPVGESEVLGSTAHQVPA